MLERIQDNRTFTTSKIQGNTSLNHDKMQDNTTFSGGKIQDNATTNSSINCKFQWWHAAFSVSSKSKAPDIHKRWMFLLFLHVLVLGLIISDQSITFVFETCDDDQKTSWIRSLIYFFHCFTVSAAILSFPLHPHCLTKNGYSKKTFTHANTSDGHGIRQITWSDILIYIRPFRKS